MNINDFVKNFRNYPILFVGTGMSLRYLKNSYSWDGLLIKSILDLGKTKKFYHDKAAENLVDDKIDFPALGSIIEDEFEMILKQDENEVLQHINDKYYELAENGCYTKRLKLYVSHLLSDPEYRESMDEEIKEFKIMRKNVSSVITTNYDTLIEDLFSFDKVVGNDILLSQPYGSVYKIHGCVNESNKIIITKDDYKKFDSDYDLIKAHMISLFIHHPIIFLGYNVTDPNIQKILETIFRFVDISSEESSKIRSNFLLVEYDKGSKNTDVTDHDVVLKSGNSIRINKLKTDDYVSIYKAIENLNLPVSALDIRKVERIAHEIRTGGEFRVSITENIDDLEHKDKVLVVGSTNEISYKVMRPAELLNSYFIIVDDNDWKRLSYIDDLTIQESQYFPICKFSLINTNINKSSVLRENQKTKLDNYFETLHSRSRNSYNEKTIEGILLNQNIPMS
ncbi:SIR2 family protein [Mycoplasmatota bacterium WC44]